MDIDPNEFDKQMEDIYDQILKYEQEVQCMNNRILKAIGNQIGQGFLKDLKIIIKDCEILYYEPFKFASEPNDSASFQEESSFGCIPAIWVRQQSEGMDGDSFTGEIWVKLKDCKYLEMKFSM